MKEVTGKDDITIVCVRLWGIKNEVLSGEIMKGLEIVVDTKDGAVVYLNYGQTYIADDGRKITYEQMLEWMFDGSLKQHGFYPHKCRTSQSNSNNNYAARNAQMMALLAATL